MIKQETIDRIREQTDIVELIAGYLPLKKVGRNYRGLCPFHAERSPSFYVNPERQSYHCFGCGVGGTAISFVMAHEKLDFPEAVKHLGRRLGIAVEPEQGGGQNQALYDACEAAAGFFEAQLAKTPRAKSYLERRGLSGDTARRFRLGFAPGGTLLRSLARSRGLSEEVLLRAGLVAQREGSLVDYFFDRLMFPVFSVSGRVVGFSGRVLDDREPKYLNSPDTAVFHKGELLYGLFQAKAYIRAETPLLVEGNFDLLSLVDCGVNNVVAGLGTALTPAQALLLRRFNSSVVLCYDGDEAGRKACRRALETIISAGIDPQVALLPAGTDPDAFVREKGRAGLDVLLASRRDFVDVTVEGRRLSTISEQRQVLGEVVALLNRVSDEATRELYANKIAARFRVDKDRLLRRPTRARETPGTAARILEEKLVAAAAQNAELAGIAAELSMSEVVADPGLRAVAQLAEANCGQPGYGPGMLMDMVEDEETRRRIAGWTFGSGMPTAVEFREKVRSFRSAWLGRMVGAAHRAGDEQRAQKLLEEQGELKKAIVRERSSRR